MWSTIILNCALSITIIFIANQLWDYCKNNYTSQKTKNLVEMHASKYKQIAEDMERNDPRSALIYSAKNVGLEEGGFEDRYEVSKHASSRGVETPAHLVSRQNGVIQKNDEPSIFCDNTQTISEFLPKEEKEWVNKELTEFIETL